MSRLRIVPLTSVAVFPSGARSATFIGPSISEAMISAGLRVLRDAGMSDDHVQADKLVVAEIYRVMYEAAMATRDISSQPA